MGALTAKVVGERRQPDANRAPRWGTELTAPRMNSLRTDAPSDTQQAVFRFSPIPLRTS
jgi:hypothetical protein